MGNDYDRAKGANATLEFIYGPMFGYSGSFSDRGNRDNKHTLDLTVKSGTIGSTFFMEDTNTATYLQGGAGQCMYLSSAGSQTNVGTRNVIIEGGDICSIGGGIDSYNNAPSNNNTPNTTTNYERLSFNLRIKGGTIDGVKAVAGYVHDKDGRLIAFAMIANNLVGRDEALWRVHENIIKELLNLKSTR